MAGTVTTTDLFPETHDRVLFNWTRLHSHTLFSRLSTNISQEVASYLLTVCRQLVPAISRQSLKLYCLDPVSVETKSLNWSVPEGLRACLISEKVVMLVGGSERTREASFVHIPTGTVELLESLLVARNSPGVVKKDTLVYVFGGNFEPTRTCEKFNLLARVWSRLPSMHRAKFAFTPVLYRDTILLPEVRQSEKVVEVFSVIPETFHLLSLQMPFTDTGSTAVMDDNHLVVITCHGQVGRWNVDLGQGEFQVKDFSGNRESLAYCAGTPVKVGRQVYWQGYDTTKLVVFALDGDTMTVQE